MEVAIRFNVRRAVKAAARRVVLLTFICLIQFVLRARRRRENVAGEPVTLIGFFNSASGLGTAVRGLARVIERRRRVEISISTLAPSQYFAYKCRTEDRADDTCVPRGQTAIHLYNPDIFIALMLHYGPGVITRYQRNLIIVNWETEQLPSGWKQVLGCYDRIAAPSTFTADAVRRALNRHVYVIPNHVPLKAIRRADSKRKVFQFLCMFDALSSVRRKNPGGVIVAFAMARVMLGQTRPVRLVVKCHTETPKEVLLELRDMAKDASVEFVTDTLTRSDMDILWAQTDCLVSLHRSEGFGLAIAEALSRGIPVITSRQGGVLDFACEEHVFFVEGSAFADEQGDGSYAETSGWIDPDLTAAAKQMVFAVTNYREAVRRACLGRQRVAKVLGRKAGLEALKQALMLEKSG